MTRKGDNERLAAALEWAGLPAHERSVRVYRARKSPPTAPIRGNPFAEFTSGQTATVRMNRRVIEIASAAWPDGETRKSVISKLIVIAALEELKNKEKSRIAQ